MEMVLNILRLDTPSPLLQGFQGYGYIREDKSSYYQKRNNEKSTN
jgi:hypothetical protein